MPASPPPATRPSRPTLSETDRYRLSAPVVKFGAALGMKPETAANVFTIFNILILVGGRRLWLDEDASEGLPRAATRIQKHLVDARTATEEATARLNSVEERLSKLDEQIAAMRAQAEADIAREEQRIQAQRRRREEQDPRRGRGRNPKRHHMARREIQKYAAELAIEQAARKLVVTPETDRLLVESFAHRARRREQQLMAAC